MKAVSLAMGTRESDSPSLDAPGQALSDLSPCTRLSGPGEFRQTRRLQIRNARINAPKLPPRSTTPSTTSPRPTGTTDGIPIDIENRSPEYPKAHARASSVPRARSKGVLSEVGGTPKSKKSRQQLSSTRTATPKTGRCDAMNLQYDGEPLPNDSPRHTPRSRNAKLRPKMEDRRTFSVEVDTYIEQLEAELVTIQAHMVSITSPDIIKEKGARMRALQAENKKLSEDLAQWESQYEQTVQEQVAKHFEIESGLRLYIRNLEQNAEEATFKSQEMEQRLDVMTQNLDAAEKANVQLEKRVEIMSELLAASPARIDLHTESAQRGRRHLGTKSALFRFPAMNSINPPVDRPPTTRPTSPQYSPLDLSPTVPVHSIRPHLALRTICPLSDQASDAESIFSDSHFGDAVASPSVFGMAPLMAQSTTMPTAVSPKSRPVRRMRKFGAGSVKPKPLILSSSASHSEFPEPTSAPPHERSATIHEFPEFAWSTGSPVAFSGRRRASTTSELQTEGSTDNTPRRRASTEANAQTRFNLKASPLIFSNRDNSGSPQNDSSDGMIPGSVESQATTREYPLVGPIVRRNLMEELTAARSPDTGSFATHSWAGSSQPGPELPQQSMECTLSIQQWNDDVVSEQPPPDETPTVPLLATENPVHENLGDSDDRASPTPSVTSLVAVSSAATVQSQHRRKKSTHHTLSTWQRLRLLFGNLCRHPTDFARHLIQTAQARMRIPLPLLSVQWWLVGVLLGPMARRCNMLPPSSTDCRERGCTLDRDKNSSPALRPYSPTGQAGSMEYGTMWITPPASPRLNGVSGGLVRRTAADSNNGTSGSCPHQHGHHPARHNPWLWLRFSFTLAFAVGIAFKDGPGSLMKATTACACALSRSRPLSQIASERRGGGGSGRQSPAIMA